METRDPSITEPRQASEEQPEPNDQGASPFSDKPVTATSSGSHKPVAPQNKYSLSEEAKRLGFPMTSPCPNDTPDTLRWIEARKVTGRDDKDIVWQDLQGVCLATVCSTNYVHFARALVRSFLSVHPEAQAAVLVIDWDGESALEIAGAELLSGRDVVGDPLPYMLLKYDATEVCCAGKPYIIDYLARKRGVEKILYLDSDIYVFHPLTRMITLLSDQDFVVIPHTQAPYPNPERFDQRPSLGDIYGAGLVNAGMFGLRVNADSMAFIATWRDLVTGPGAFLKELGQQHEQNFFNWVICFAPKVLVLRDPAYNVAYWNLHDRSLRYHQDDSERCRWTVNGAPLVAFHFSGFSPKAPRVLSKHDNRYSLYILPSVAHLVEFYLEELATSGGRELMLEDYPCDLLPSGVRITPRMREVFKKHELALWREADPWSEEGEQLFCQALLKPVPGSGSLLPALLKSIYDDRPDLKQLIPQADTSPMRMIGWFLEHGVTEAQAQRLIDLYRPTIPKREGLALVDEWTKLHPGVFDGLESPMGKDRTTLIGRLHAAGLREEAKKVESLELEYYALSSVYAARQIYEVRSDLQGAFPDPIFENAEFRLVAGSPRG